MHREEKIFIQTLANDAHDKNEWIQCSHPRRGCGRIYRIHGVKVESDIIDVVEKTDDYDNPTIVGLENKRFKKTDIINSMIDF